MAYSDEVLADSPTGYWRLDDTSGTTVVDSSGNSRNGAYVGSPTLGGASLLPAGGGTAVTLNGTSQRITVAHNAAFNAPTSETFSFECWVQISNPDADALQVIADKTNITTSNDQWVVYWDNRSGINTHTLFFRRDADASAVLSWGGTTARDAMAAGGHLVCVSEAHTLRIYWNGVEVASRTDLSGIAVPGSTSQTLSFGARSDGTAFRLAGKLDELAVYQLTLSPSRVAAHYAAAASSSVSGPVTATLPALSAAVDGQTTIAGQSAATLPSLSATVAGEVGGITAAGIAATLPSLSATIEGTLPAPITGTVAASLPKLSASIVDDAGETVHVGLRVGITATDSAVTLATTSAHVGLQIGISSTDLAIDAIESAHVGLRINIRPHTTRDWGVDPRTPGRPAPSVVIARRDGTPVTALDDVQIGTLSTGVGVLDSWRFSVDRDNPRGKLIESVATEAHLYRGNVLMSKGPVGPGRLEGGRMVYDCADPRWYLNTGRYITRIPQLNWCFNGDFAKGAQGWAGGFDAGSAPEAAPVFYVVEEAESTSGYGLRIEGVDKVVTAKAVVETAAVFYPNRPYAWEPLANGFLSGGAQKIRDAITGIPQGAAVTVEGHTADADAGDGYELSVRRAQAARNVILAARSDLTVTAVGKGETEPVATNSTLEGQAKNRRVEILWTGIETATGHRQFVWQARNVSNPVDSKVPLPVTVAGRMRIGEWLGAPKDGWALRLMLMQGSDIVTDPDGQPIEATASMSEATPRERWHDYSATIDIPPDGVTYRLVWRLYPPAGWAVWTDVGVYPHEQLGFFDVDQALIVKALTEHVQDPAFGHGPLGIGTRTPLTGITRTKEYEFLTLKPYGTAIEELVAPAKGVEVDCEVTPTTATIVTHYPRQGSPSGFSLTHGGPRSIIKAYRPIPANSRGLASSLIVQAWGISSNRIKQYARDEQALGGTLLEAIVDADSDTPPSELDELAAQALARSIHPTAAWELQLDPARTSEILDAIGKGDTSLVSLPDEGVHGIHRVVQMEWDTDTDGLTVQVTPEEA